jgi:hypothetical protein
MTTPDIADLSERLRAAESSGHGGVTTNWHRNPDGPEAANTIKRQAAEIERLRALLMLARPFVADDTEATCDLADRIDAALTGEDLPQPPNNERTA